MAQISEELLAKITVAKDALAAAKAKDAAHDDAVAGLRTAVEVEDTAKTEALAAHQEANGLSDQAIDALKAELERQ